MLPAEEPESPPELTPRFLALLTLGAALGQLFVLLMLLSLGAQPTRANLGIATLVAYGTALAVAVPRIPPPPGRALGFVPAPRLAWTAAGLLVPSLLLASEVDNIARALLPPPEALQPPGDTEEWSGVEVAEAVLVLAVVLPAVEEVFFRGLLQPALVERLGRGRGVLAAASLNGLAALLLGPNPWAFAPVMARALVLGAVREGAGSLLPCLGLAALFGVTHVAAAQGAFGIPGFDDLSGAHTPLAWLAPAALLTGMGLRLCQVAARHRDGDAQDGGS